MTAAVLTGIGVAHPGPLRQDELWQGFFAEHFAGSRLAGRVFANAGVATRHGVANPLVGDDVSAWTTGRRMQRYIEEAMPLGKDAVSAALAAAGVAPADVGLFAVASCTGYATPGLDILLARDLAMASDVRRLFVGHMGCYAALPGLGTVADFVAAQGRTAVLLCLELTSLHIQPPTREPAQVVAHALFSDAAAAVVVQPAARTGYRVLDVASRTDPATADQMTWQVTDNGFRMVLSPRVADTLAGHLVDLVGELLDRHGLSMSDVDGWAVHPGGPRILDVVARELDLPGHALEVSRTTLRDHGNCSSATVLMVLDALCTGGAPPSRVMMLAFGPGLTLYAGLLSR